MMDSLNMKLLIHEQNMYFIRYHVLHYTMMLD